MPQQLELPGMSSALQRQPFGLVDVVNYGVTEELLAHLKVGDEAQVKSALYFLRSVTVGFDSAEIPQNGIGLPHCVLLGMTRAERLAIYRGIDVQRQYLGSPIKLNGLPTPNHISELVKAGFSRSPGPLQMIARQGNDGYDTRPGGLVRRMRQVLQQFPDADEAFRNAALSTIRPLNQDIQHVSRLNLDELIEGLTGRFMWKYGMHVKALAQY